ncbi:calcium-binding protein, partial [Psychrobacter fozii]|uniref:calcium-binding protein n=1 Tax=Psychrobacter fozii TaxID=198480 RepID=UPI002A0A43EB
TGNDTLNGGDFEKDNYIFQAGYGQDTINDRGYSTSSHVDVRNDVTFDDINASDTIFNRVGNTLIIQTAAEDSITLVNYFTGSYDRAYNFIFKDEVISSEAVLSRVYTVTGTDEDNELTGWSSNDILIGGAGNDTLNGGSGYDTLIGGTGNDTLNGGDFEKDNYIFQAGYGQDTINDRGYSTSSHVDVRNDVTFDDINASDTIFNRVGNTLIIQTSAEDNITLVNYFTGSYDRAYNFIFADKTISSEDVLNMSYTLTGNDEANVLDGWSSNDIVDGKAGDDTLNGEAGDDILFGGEGNDILNGGSGNDTYIYSLGDGQDIINNYDSSANRQDTLKLGEGISSDNIWIAKDNTNLTIDFLDDDSLVIQNWFSNKNYQLDEIKFDDGRVLDKENINEIIATIATHNVSQLNQDIMSSVIESSLVI